MRATVTAVLGARGNSTAAGLTAALIACGVAACGQENDPRACTAVGCSSGVSIDVGQLANPDRQVTVCVDEHCRPATPGEPVDVSGDGGVDHRVQVRVTVRDADEHVVRRIDRSVALEAHEPNGPDCPPTCWGTRLRWDAAEALLREG